MTYEAIVDNISRQEWEGYAASFTDYSIYQTWPYQEVRARMEGQEVSRVIIKDERDHVVIMCQIRIKHVKPLGLRIGYAQWGPLIRRKEFRLESVAAALRELRQVYLCNKVNVMRIVPNVVKDDTSIVIEDIFVGSGFQRTSNVPQYHTMILPLEGDEEGLRKRLHRSWRRYLRKAEKSNIEIREGTSLECFEILKRLYLLAKQRKQFKGLEYDVFMRTQELLSASEKMNIVVAYCEGQPVTAHITSHLGDTALGILAASNEIALQYNASYLVWWRTLLTGKYAGMKQYDMSGVDPIDNPNVYQFKSRMGGEDTFYIGAFEATTNTIIKNMWHIGEKIYRLIKK
jgi:lipid II:glycine glycyltransferase (peptidoglycan interpeptide bridge formation enzyme)